MEGLEGAAFTFTWPVSSAGGDDGDGDGETLLARSGNILCIRKQQHDTLSSIPQPQLFGAAALVGAANLTEIPNAATRARRQL